MVQTSYAWKLGPDTHTKFQKCIDTQTPHIWTIRKLMYGHLDAATCRHLISGHPITVETTGYLITVCILPRHFLDNQTLLHSLNTYIMSGKLLDTVQTYSTYFPNTTTLFGILPDTRHCLNTRTQSKPFRHCTDTVQTPSEQMNTVQILGQSG